MEIVYLLDNNDREHEIMERFDQFLAMVSPFLESLGIRPMYAWYLIEFQMDDLIPGMKGDVDILAGNLEPISDVLYEQSLDKFREIKPDIKPYRLHKLAAIDLAEKGNLKWAPSLDYLVGVEVKCSYQPWNAPIKVEEVDMKSRKSSPGDRKGIHKQINKLLKMGFNKVGLFDFIANPPADGVGSQPWNLSSHISTQSAIAMEKIFNKRLPEDSAAGHGACSFSGIVGREEHHAGTYDYPVFRIALNNPLLLTDEIKINRKILEQNLTKILEAIPRPRNAPAIFVRNRKTGNIKFINEGVIRG